MVIIRIPSTSLYPIEDGWTFVYQNTFIIHSYELLKKLKFGNYWFTIILL